MSGRAFAGLASVWTVLALVAAVVWSEATRRPVPVISVRDGEAADSAGYGFMDASPGGDGGTAASRGELEETTGPNHYRGGPRHTGRADSKGPSAPQLLWAFSTDRPVRAQVVVDVVDGDVEYVVASTDRHVYRLHANGRQRWKRFVKGRVQGTPLLLDDGSAVVGTSDGTLYRLDRDGGVVWEVALGGEVDQAPTLSSDGGILVSAGRTVQKVGLDGGVEWSQELGGKVFTSPAVGLGDHVYVGSQDDHVYALSSSGTVKWRFRTAGDNDSSVLVDSGGNLYFGSDDRHVHSLTPGGQHRWSALVHGYVRSSPALADSGGIVVGVYGPRSQLVHLRTRDGAPRWQFAVTPGDSGESGIQSDPVIDAEGRIYFGAQDDYIYCVTPEGGLLWVFRTGGDVRAAPVIHDGVLLVGSQDGIVYALADPK